MRSALAKLIPWAAALALLATNIVPVLAQTKDPINDINELCSFNTVFSDSKDSIVCLRTGASMQLTPSSQQYLRNDANRMCCRPSDKCLLSNETTPRVGCWDETSKTVRTESTAGTCELSGNSCMFVSSVRFRNVSFSTEGVTRVTSVKNGQAVTGAAAVLLSSGAFTLALAVGSVGILTML